MERRTIMLECSYIVDFRIIQAYFNINHGIISKITWHR